MQKITEYKGPSGLLEVTSHSLSAGQTLRIYEIKTLNSFLPYAEAEKFRSEFLARKIKIRELTNSVYLDKWTDNEEFVKTCMEIRWVNPKRFTINTETLIYNDTVAFYYYQPEIFCVEIVNPRLARMQQEIFEFIFNAAEKPSIGRGGRTSLF